MIRPCEPGDVPVILRLVRDLAEYEKALHEVRATADDLHRSLFGPSPAVFAHVADDGDGAGVVGFALWYVTYSTWTGRHGLYLEDLYVRPEARGRGHGRALMAELAGVCVERGYARMEWSVLDWNAPAIAFYRSIGARPMDEWTVQRVDGDELRRLAG
ncbi:GNAT family N-acetyltransferase [Allonocardiopsis opalescens]|uniref:L-amino acid N-acyltransferase YncA n=1 Tax=Allonocardiopsis opalescens TaxID=1144618 RepID=A0A2T0QDV9_9ACTN|nr:GNAT family N-acetyltransferase [Allonocardiopsis opalescens]PRY02060.1 L-amino acid N-acyltransferase YncA [Allonocardiopsis opalescens]